MRVCLCLFNNRYTERNRASIPWRRDQPPIGLSRRFFSMPAMVVLVVPVLVVPVVVEVPLVLQV